MRNSRPSLRQYNGVWECVQAAYEWQWLASEHGLQAALYHSFLGIYPQLKIVIEPTWEGVWEGRRKPDMVFVYDGMITDIFELKYVPFDYPAWKKDIDKLVSYVDGEEKFYDVVTDPITGRYSSPYMVSKDCRLHFGVVGRPDAEALCTETIRSRIEKMDRIPENAFYHWIGQSGEKRDWYVRLIDQRGDD